MKLSSRNTQARSSSKVSFHLFHIVSVDVGADRFSAASILTRQWAKKYYPMYIDIDPTACRISRSLVSEDIKTVR